MPKDDPSKARIALMREAALAAEHIAIGATAIGKANYAHHAYYYQAFFALSVGFERSAKIALIVDHALTHGGVFPTTDEVRDFAHGLQKLIAATGAIGARRRSSRAETDDAPDSPIHGSIVHVLDQFARNITRYYNVDIVTGLPAAASRTDPIAAWDKEVVTPIFETFCSQRRRNGIAERAEVIDAILRNDARVSFTAEGGKHVDSIEEASAMTGRSRAAAPYVRMHVLQFARFFSHVMSDLTFASYQAQLESIPHLSDFYRMFNNEDKYFRSRKTWSIYRE